MLLFSIQNHMQGLQEQLNYLTGGARKREVEGLQRFVIQEYNNKEEEYPKEAFLLEHLIATESQKDTDKWLIQLVDVLKTSGVDVTTNRL